MAQIVSIQSRDKIFYVKYQYGCTHGVKKVISSNESRAIRRLWSDWRQLGLPALNGAENATVIAYQKLPENW